MTKLVYEVLRSLGIPHHIYFNGETAEFTWFGDLYDLVIILNPDGECQAYHKEIEGSLKFNIDSIPEKVFDLCSQLIPTL